MIAAVVLVRHMDSGLELVFLIENLPEHHCAVWKENNIICAGRSEDDLLEVDERKPPHL